MLAVLAVMAFAETWTGKLVDANCGKDQADPSACTVTDTTKSFALQVGEKVYRLNEEGNTKVIAALKDRADRMKDESDASKAPIVAKLTGTFDQDMIKVESVQVQ